MRVAARAGFCVLVLAVSAGLIQGQQSNGTTKTDSRKRSSKSAVKQEFGPQTMPRHGDRMAKVKPEGQSGSQVSQPAGEPDSKTEKIKFKQEFGPQTPSRRSDRVTTAQPKGQAGKGNEGAGAGRAAYRQEFGPSQGTKHQDAMQRPPSKNRQRKATSK